METKVTEEYAYFQPGGMLFLLSSKNDQRMKAVPEQSMIAQSGQAMESKADKQMDSQAEPSLNAEYEQPITDQTEKEKSDLYFDDQVDRLINWSNELASKHGLTIARRKERELFFPGAQTLPALPSFNIDSDKEIRYLSPQPVRRGAFSIIPVDVRAQIRDEKNIDGFADLSKLIDLSLELDNSRTGSGQPFLDQEITLELVVPNWLSSPASETGGGGGPGSRPTPFRGESNTKSYKFHFLPTVEKLCPSNTDDWGKGVKVAILDTAPSVHDIVAAYEIYHKVNPAKKIKDHWLLESLLAQRDPQDPRPAPFALHPASTEELMRMRSVHLRDHNYNMTDHGLLVSGIGHSIAPAAEIHLYEVLNFEGVGDLESIAGGLWKVAEEQYQVFTKTGKVQPLVVNCSLMLNIPLQGDPDSPNKPTIIPSNSPLPIIGHRLTDLNDSILGKIKTESDWVNHGGSLIMWICDLLF